MKKCIALLLMLSFAAVIPTVEAKESDAEYVAKPGQNVVVSCGEKLADESILVSFGVKLPYETANENFAVTINSSDGEIVSFLEFSGGMFKLRGKTENVDIPASIKAGKEYTFGFLIEPKNMKQDIFATSSDSELWQKQSCRDFTAWRRPCKHQQCKLYKF